MLYHVSIVELKEDQLNFIPRIPESRMSGENETIERICFSSKIEGCLLAIKDIERVLYRNLTYGEDIKLFVYGIDENKINNIITPKELVDMEYVADALETNEHWILENVKVDLIKIICLDINEDEIFEDNDMRTPNEAIEDYVSEYGYKYKDCSEGIIINSLEELYDWE